jgi:hypothetical protein
MDGQQSGSGRCVIEKGKSLASAGIRSSAVQFVAIWTQLSRPCVIQVTASLQFKCMEEYLLKVNSLQSKQFVREFLNVVIYIKLRSWLSGADLTPVIPSFMSNTNRTVLALQSPLKKTPASAA